MQIQRRQIDELRAARKRCGLTINHVADAIGVNRTTLSDLERGCAHAAPTFRRAWLYVRFVELAQQEARKVIARGDY